MNASIRPLFAGLTLTGSFLLSLGFLSAADDKKSGPIWTDPAVAAKESADFLAQGEYVRPKGENAEGVQVIALGKGQFYLSRFAGGLPGAGWDGKAPQVETVGKDELAARLEGLERTERKSPTLGAEAPEDAIVLFDGAPSDKVKGTVKNGLLWEGSQTADEYGSFKLHVEFRQPFKPETPPSSQDRGNSGLYLHNRYEVQVLDSFGLVYNPDWVKLPLKSDVKQWCASFYKFKTPDVPMSFPPLTWQTYDIDFTAPKFEGDKKVANARITVVHNGIKVHDDVELPKGTGAGGSRAEVPKGPILFQGHGNPVAYRNVWLVPKD